MDTSLYNLIDSMLSVPSGGMPMNVTVERISHRMPEIKNVIFNNPVTIVFGEDATKTIVKCQTENGDTFSKETGLAMAIAKKAYGNKGNFNDIFTKCLYK